MRLLVAGGGTGGHLFPGLALGEEVKTRHPRNEVLFVGTARGLETRIIPKNGFPLELIEVAPLKRQGTRGTLRGLLPICAWCKQIRDYDGYWQSVEDYIQAHSNAEFTHGICPACFEKQVTKG